MLEKPNNSVIYEKGMTHVLLPNNVAAMSKNRLQQKQKRKR